MGSTYLSSLSTGFPSPADDYLEKKLDLNEYLISNPAATFFLRAEGKSMIKAGIHPEDLLIVDRSLEPGHGKVVVATVNGDFFVRRLMSQTGKVWLVAEDPGYQPVMITSSTDSDIWGVVIYVLHPLI